MKLFFILKEGVEGLKRSVFHSFVAIAASALAISLLGLLGYGAINLQRAAEGLLDTLQFEVFISSALPDNQHADLEKRIQDLDARWRITYISREAAAATFAEEFDPELFNILKENPLPASFLIDLPAEQLQPDSARAITERISAIEGIDDVIYDRDLLKILHTGMKKLALWGFFGGLITMTLAVGMTFNAIRLKIDSQREAVRLMSLFGASPRMLRAIYWVQGSILGGVGGVISLVIIFVVALLVRMGFSSDIEISMPHPYFPILAGALLGMLGASLAVRRYLGL